MSDNNIDYTNPDYIPSSADYGRFLASPEVTVFQREILLAHYAAPGQIARNAVLAEALSSTLLIVNGSYGRLGRKALKFFAVEMPERALPSHAFSWLDQGDDGYYYSTMHNSVRAAIGALGWADEAQKKYGEFWETYTIKDHPLQTYWEGRERESQLIRRARNGQARQACIDYYKARCVVCQFDFELFYGKRGEAFIEVHHLELVATRNGEEYEIDPIKDLRPVCSNCHRMLHHRGLLPIDELKAIVAANRAK